jgi:hypothetical protein
LEVEIYQSGLPPESCCVVHQENEFVISPLFKEWVETVLVPDVIAQREMSGLDQFCEFLMGFLDTSLTLLKKATYFMESGC